CGHCQGAQPTSPNVFDRCRHVGERHLDLPAKQIGDRWSRATIRHVCQINASYHLEKFSDHMSQAPNAARAHADLAGIGLGMGDELGNRRDRKQWIHLHDMWHPVDARNRRNITNEVVVEFFEQCCIDCCGSTDHEERIAVCRRTPNRLYTDIATTARTVLDDELLTEALRQPLTNEARSNVVNTTGRKWDNDAHGPRRIGLRPRYARYSRERGSTRCQMQKLSAGKFHLEPSSHHSITSSARASSVGGTLRPRARAVGRFITNTNLADCTTGRSA